MAYFLAGALVSAGAEVVVSLLLQPVTSEPITSTNSAIRVNVLFIRCNLYQKCGMDK